MLFKLMHDKLYFGLGTSPKTYGPDSFLSSGIYILMVNKNNQQ